MQSGFAKRLISISFILFIIVAIAPALHADEITIVGTGDGVSVLKAIGKAFSEKHQDVSVSVPRSIGSSGGIKAVGHDKFIIGRVARKIKEKEQHLGLTYVPYAKIPVVFIINKSVKVDNLTSKQVCDIFRGKITNWAEVGGNNAKIKVVRREDGDSSLRILSKTFPGFKDISFTEQAVTALSTPENFELISRKKDSIGFGPYDIALSSDVKILKIDGKKPTDREYPSYGEMALIFKEKNYRGKIKEFVDFARSSSAHAAIKRAGGMPAF